jgi:cysteine synthase
MGIFCGISSGGTFAGGAEVRAEGAERLGDPAMLPDTGERYFTTVLFEGINKGSDEEPAA